ncbi:hypothetical protein KC351_g1985 [Hortaea werneckii]|nr:hypothetical protein KC351_g1985 [Hortaea werneckii]
MDEYHHHHHHHHDHLHHQQQQQQHADCPVALDSGRWLEDDEQYDHEPVTVACAYTFCRGVAGLAAHTIIYRRRRLYAGYRLHLLRDAIGTAIYFTTSESAKQLMANALWPVPTGTSCDTFCSAPGAVITALSCPFELTKLNEQLAGKVAREAQSKSGQNPSPIVDVKSGGSWNTARRHVRDRGVLGLYAGYRLHLLRDTIGTAIYFIPGRRRRS